VGITEAVFSSSGDRIRAIQAKAAVAGPSIASVGSQSPFDRGWLSRVSLQIVEHLFSVLFPSDRRICGEPFGTRTDFSSSGSGFLAEIACLQESMEET
jgi:hypothetical protein